jgi:hypothetical protein
VSGHIATSVALNVAVVDVALVSAPLNPDLCLNRVASGMSGSREQDGKHKRQQNSQEILPPEVFGEPECMKLRYGCKYNLFLSNIVEIRRDPGTLEPDCSIGPIT